MADLIVYEWIITWKTPPGNGGRPQDERVFAATREEAEDRAYERREGTGGYWFIEHCRPVNLAPQPVSESTYPSIEASSHEEPPELLTGAEAMHMLGIESRDTFGKLDLPRVYLYEGAAPRYHRADVLKFIDSSKRW